MRKEIMRLKMAKKKKKLDEMDFYNAHRRNWNGINPVSRIVENKKKKKPKHKQKQFEE